MRLDFNFEKFSSLPSSQLADYVEPFLAVGSFSYSQDASTQLIDVVTNGDEAHVVYALELLRTISPSTFARIAIEHVGSSNAAVCCAASRLLKSLDRNHVPSNICECLHAVPISALMSIHPATHRVVKVGETQKFIDELLAHFGCE